MGTARNGERSGVALSTSPAAKEGPRILEVRDLRVYYHTPRGAVKAVDGVSFALRPGERFGLVGESGSGKTTLARLALRLLTPDVGEIRYRGRSIAGMSGAELRQFRRSVQPIFQDTAATFNPRRTVRGVLRQALGQNLARGHVHSSVQVEDRLVVSGGQLE